MGHAVGKEQDVGALRIRVIVVDEQEIRKIASRVITPCQDYFSDRHGARWHLMKAFADVFRKQLGKVTRAEEHVNVLTQSWGDNLCGTFKREVTATEQDDSYPRFLNNFLRIHVPVPLVREGMRALPVEPEPVLC